MVGRGVDTVLQDIAGFEQSVDDLTRSASFDSAMLGLSTWLRIKNSMATSKLVEYRSLSSLLAVTSMALVAEVILSGGSAKPWSLYLKSSSVGFTSRGGGFGILCEARAAAFARRVGTAFAAALAAAPAVVFAAGVLVDTNEPAEEDDMVLLRSWR